jgi:hypothetical protein
MRPFKNHHRNSAAGEKSHIFSFQVKRSKEEILRLYSLRMTEKDKLTKILEHSHSLLTFNTSLLTSCVRVVHELLNIRL